MSSNPLQLTVCVIGRASGWPGQPTWTDPTQAYFVSPFVHDYGPPAGVIRYTLPLSLPLPSNPSNAPMYVTMQDANRVGQPAIFIDLTATRFNNPAFVPLGILVPGITLPDWNLPTSGDVSSVFGRSGAVVATTGDYAVAQVTGAAPLASPGLTGTPTAPTAAPGTNTTQLATTAFVLANGGSNASSIWPALINPPVAANWTPVNQNGMLFTSKSNRLVIQSDSAGANSGLYVTSALPSTPYTVEVGVVINNFAETCFTSLALFNSTTPLAPISIDYLVQAASQSLRRETWVSISSGSGSSLATQNLFSWLPTLVFLRVTDDGINRTWWFSTNGLDFIQFFQELSGAVITPTNAGILNFGTPTTQQVISIYHFRVANSILPQFAN